MRRRRFVAALAAGGLTALAGCAGPNGSLRMIPVDDESALAEEYTSPVDGLPTELRDLLARTIEEGPQTWDGAGPPFDRERPVEYRGAYYRFEHEIVDTWTEMQYVVEADYDPERPVAGPTIAYEDLPPEDRAALENLIPPPEGHETGEGYDLGRGHRYPPDAESVLVPESRHEAVSYEGTAYPIRVAGGREIDVHTFRYTVEQVAADEGELAANARERYRFTLSGLSDAERDVVEAAIDDGYRIESDESPPAAFESLVSRFRAHEAVQVDEYSGEWLTRHVGSDYWAYVGFPDDASASGTPGRTPSITPPPR